MCIACGLSGPIGRQEGEPLSINYIDAMLPRAARRDALRTNFFFECDCLRCAQAQEVFCTLFYV